MEWGFLFIFRCGGIYMVMFFVVEWEVRERVCIEVKMGDLWGMRCRG
jgi:hypothetical protein